MGAVSPVEDRGDDVGQALGEGFTDEGVERLLGKPAERRHERIRPPLAELGEQKEGEDRQERRLRLRIRRDPGRVLERP